jgi:hypothetical protein
VRKGTRKSASGGAEWTFFGFFDDFRVGNRHRVPGCFCAWSVRGSHVLKNQNVGNPRVKNSRGGGKGCFGGARDAAGARRCSMGVEIQNTGGKVKRSGSPRRATRRGYREKRDPRGGQRTGQHVCPQSCASPARCAEGDLRPPSERGGVSVCDLWWLKAEGDASCRCATPPQGGRATHVFAWFPVVRKRHCVASGPQRNPALASANPARVEQSVRPRKYSDFGNRRAQCYS